MIVAVAHATHRYDKGKELSQRLSMLQDGFAGLQTKEMERVQQTQSAS